MDPEAWALIVIVALLASCTAAIGFLLASFLREKYKRDLTRGFSRAVVSVLQNEPVPDYRIQQIQRHHADYSANMKRLGGGEVNLSQDLWSIVRLHDSLSPSRFKSIFKFNLADGQRSEIYRLIEEVREAEPFGQLPDRWKNRLNDAITATDATDPTRVKAALTELSSDLYESLTVTVMRDEQRQRTNRRFQWIGIILTIITFIIATILAIILAP